MFGGSGFKIEPVEFTDCGVEMNGMRMEYHVDEKNGMSRIQFHIWPEPAFPENTQDLLEKALLNGSYNKESVVIDYVPEVESWYVELNSLAVKPTAGIVKTVARKIARVVNSDG